MSNPQTYYITKNETGQFQDLSGIFLPISLGTQYPTATGFKLSNGQDLNQIFANISSGIPLGYNVNFKSVAAGNLDLSQIFAKNISEFNSLGGFITTDSGTNLSGVLASSFYLLPGYSYFNFILYGGGGSGYNQPIVPSISSTGGGGSGSVVKGYRIPYKNGTTIMNSIEYTISGGDTTGSNYPTTVTIKYSDNSSILLIAGSGQSVSSSSGTSGAAGGTPSYNNSSVFYDGSNNIILVNGANGGNYISNGSTNGYTSSGSGAYLQVPLTYYIPYENPPSASNTFYIDPVTSQGGGQLLIVSGYGAGGAGTSNNYSQGGYSADYYRKGSPGCITYYLSGFYTINSQSNVIITEYNNNGYTGLVFEVDNISSIASVNITINTLIQNATIIIVGAGGGGGYAGAGGGGGGTTILTGQNLSTGTTYDISVGNGGRGGYLVSGSPTTAYANGVDGGNSSFSTYTSNGGGGGGSFSTNNKSGGNGGSINSTFGGGGGGGGGEGVGNGIYNTGGTGGKNSANSNTGVHGQNLQYVSGQSGVSGYNYAGSGGDSYYSNNNIPIYIPFYTLTTSQILVGGGGGGGGSGIYVTPMNASGFSGNGVGGNYGYISYDGESSISSISTGYGNGGGGESGSAAGIGGAGGNGVVILWWAN